MLWMLCFSCRSGFSFFAGLTSVMWIGKSEGVGCEIILFCPMLWLLPSSSWWGSSGWIACTGSRWPFTDISKLPSAERRESWRCPSQFCLFALLSSQQFLGTLSPICTPPWIGDAGIWLQSVVSTAPCLHGPCLYRPLIPLAGSVTCCGYRWPVRHWLLLSQGFHQPVSLLVLADAFWLPPYCFFRFVIQHCDTHSYFVLASLTPLLPEEKLSVLQ